MRNREWLIPLTGVVFVILVIIGFAIGGEPPDADDPVREIVDYYVDDKDSVQFGAVVGGLAVVFLVFFFGYLRKILRAAEGEGGWLSAVAFGGSLILATGVAFDATISFAIAEAAEDIEPASVQALQALWDNDWVPIAVGMIVILFSTGISIVRYGALPKWVGWLAIVLGIAAATPAGFIAFFGVGVWILTVSVILSMRARPAVSPSPPAP
jgi:hypothetical protein